MSTSLNEQADTNWLLKVITSFPALAHYAYLPHVTDISSQGTTLDKVNTSSLYSMATCQEWTTDSNYDEQQTRF